MHILRARRRCARDTPDEHIYVVYEERAMLVPIEGASVLHATIDLAEAKAYARAHHGVVYVYTMRAEGESVNGELVYYQPQ
jgi:hypothetical protein